MKDLRNQLKDLTTAYAKSEDDLKVMSATVSFLRRFLPLHELPSNLFTSKALQSVGQIVGEVLRQLTEEKFIVKVKRSLRPS